MFWVWVSHVTYMHEYMLYFTTQPALTASHFSLLRTPHVRSQAQFVYYSAV